MKKNKFVSDHSKLFNLARNDKKISAGAAVRPPFLHSSILYLSKATAMPNLRAVTLYLVEFLWLLVLVSKSVTSAPSLSISTRSIIRTKITLNIDAEGRPISTTSDSLRPDPVVGARARQVHIHRGCPVQPVLVPEWLWDSEELCWPAGVCCLELWHQEDAGRLTEWPQLCQKVSNS